MKIGNFDSHNPLDILHCQIAFSSRDYSIDNRDKIIYGIICGWGEDCREGLEWSEEFFDEIADLHKKYIELRQSIGSVL